MKKANPYCGNRYRVYNWGIQKQEKHAGDSGTLIRPHGYSFFGSSSFFAASVFALCVKMDAPAPIEAVTIPIRAASTVGFSSGLSEADSVATGWVVTTGAVVTGGADGVATMICGEPVLIGCSVPYSVVSWPAMT